MDPLLSALIEAFEQATEEALGQFLRRAKLVHPFEWRKAGLPRTGTLEGEPPIRYAFHGIGLALWIGTEHIDFDFGFDGRTGGFNEWWLQQFAEEHQDRFRELTERPRLQAALDAARQAGAIGRRFADRQDRLEYRLAAGAP